MSPRIARQTGQARPAAPVPVRTAHRLLPNGGRIRGTNIVVQLDLGWQHLWPTWPWDSWIKPQIDNGILAGANCFRLLGSYKAIADGTMTQATYLAHWDQVLAYTQSLGVYMYVCCGGDFGTNYGGTFYTQAFIAAQALAVSHICSKYRHVVAMDLVSEQPAWYGANGYDVYWGIKKAHPEMPLTSSVFPNNQSQCIPSAGNGLALVSPYADFLDLHLYPHLLPLASDFFDGYFAVTDKLLMIGEFGAAATATPIYDAVITAMGHTSPGGQSIAGCCQWACTDQETADQGHFGLYDASFAPRTAYINKFATLPT